MAYVYPNFQTKKALKEAVATGQKVTVRKNTPMGQMDALDGEEYVEGPHYPQPHKWYGKVTIKGGFVTSVR